jgi:hypothetical protein
MKDILKEYDYKPFPSDPQDSWKNTVRLVRLAMVKKGLLAKGTGNLGDNRERKKIL